jgi:hypothetical protein
MKSIVVRTIVNSNTYKGILEETEKKLSSFFEISREDLSNMVSYELKIYESAADGVTLSIYSADVTAKLRNQNG